MHSKLGHAYTHIHTHTHHAKFHSRMEHKHDHWAPKWEHYTEHRWAEQPVPCLHTHITHTLTLHTHIPAFVTLVTPNGLPCSPCYSLSSHTYQSQLIGGLLNEIFLFQNWYDTLHIGNTAHVHSYKYVLTITPTYPSLRTHICTLTLATQTPLESEGPTKTCHLYCSTHTPFLQMTWMPSHTPH